MGYRFEHLAFLIDLVEDKARIGVCLDTAHTFAAGYDLATKHACEKTFDKFDQIVGFSYLKGMHLNDSKTELSSRVDRHECLGKGKLGLEAFKYIARDSRFDNMPLILETPDPSIYEQEIQLLYQFAEKK